MEYLDFEKELEELELQIQETTKIGQNTNSDVKQILNELNTKFKEKKKNLYQNLTAWQRVKISRHPNRPYTLDYINYLAGETFIELHGDRNFSDDKAMIGGFGKIENESVMFIGQQKGNNTNEFQSEWTGSGC